MKSKLLILLIGAGLLAATSGAPSAAHSRHVSRCWQTSPGLVLQTSSYQDPDGTYESYAGLVRDVNGTPCGIECSRPWAQRIWFASPPGWVCE
ncbi:MAG: hypothetical protein WAN31_10240 [Methylovirgula sp.]|jgi:hypothetical protein